MLLDMQKQVHIKISEIEEARNAAAKKETPAEVTAVPVAEAAPSKEVRQAI